MSLFKRKKPETSLCPRCSQIVAEDDGLVCPMCGWDLRDAYDGPSGAAEGRTAEAIAPGNGAAGDHRAA